MVPRGKRAHSHLSRHINSLMFFRSSAISIQWRIRVEGAYPAMPQSSLAIDFGSPLHRRNERQILGILLNCPP